MLGLKKGLVTLYPHQKSWKEYAEHKISLLKSVLSDTCIDAQHVGSTAIIGIYAKPIIDIAVAVKDLNDIYPYVELLEKKGINYRKVEETGQILFTIGFPEENVKTHHIHVIKADSPNWSNYLNFRDYLNAFPDKAKEYNDLKIMLANKYPDNRKAYTLGKKELIDRLLYEAKIWQASL